jgi:copper chaperone
MKTYKFKTNINCGGCKASVAPYLNELEGIESWDVDTSNNKKILTIKTDQLTETQIIDTVREAGFEVEKYSPSIFDKLFN